jgi:hypothetical protein
VNKKNTQGETETSRNTIYSQEKAGYTGRQWLTLGNRGSGSLFTGETQVLLLGTTVHTQEEVVSPLY